jgi:penicillin amidase
MSRTLKVVVGSSIAVLSVAMVIAVLGFRLVRKSLPENDGEISLPILSKPVHVFRDKYVVPHLYAESSVDLYAAAGYVAAQDRLWQMDLTRRAVHGTLSEIFGKTTLPSDRFLRTWGLRRIAEKIAPRLSPESKSALAAYAAGVNEFIRTHENALPVEFSILGYKPAPWRMEDSIGYIRLMGFKLCFSWYFEAALGRAVERLGLPAGLELFPAVLENTPVIVAESLPKISWASRLDAFLADGLATLEFLGFPGAVPGSNSWAVSGSRSVSGRSMLANDPHLELTLPSIWYEMHLAAPDIEVAGMTLAGVPGVVIGHNRAIAWGLTNGTADDLDFYFERLNPENPDQYFYDGAWRNLETEIETIPVKGDNPETFVIRRTHHGPIISAVHPVYEKDSIAVSMAWTGARLSDDLRAFQQINRAGNWEEFEHALRHFAVPCQNFVYADTAGNIGYRAGGVIPIRRDGRGYLPYAGWENTGEWIGEIPFDEMPHALNPPAGYVATANNQMTSSAYKYYISNGWEPTSRIERITELLQAQSRHDVASFQRMQTDLLSSHARRMLPLLLAHLSSVELNAEEKNVVQLMRDWDGAEEVMSLPAAVYNVWFLKFLEKALRDDLPPADYESYMQWSMLGIRAGEHLLLHPQSAVIDDRATPGVESVAEIVVAAFRETMRYLQETLGPTIGDWQWGRLHALTISHALGKQKPLDYLFNAGPFPIGGSANTIWKAEYRLTKPYHADVGPSMRQIVDLAKPERSWVIVAGGQSGQPFSAHYRDQIELWRDGKYRVASMRRAEIERTAIAHLALLPAERKD